MLRSKRNIKENNTSAAFNLMPHMFPYIRISPFLSNQWSDLLRKDIVHNEVVRNPSFWLDQSRELQFFDSGRAALFASLMYEGLKRDDEVLIITTTDGPYISSCVTKTIEKVCQWSRNLTQKTRTVLVIHEFGFPCPYSKIKPCLDKGLPIIEDCAYATGSRIKGAAVGTIGDYAIYSLTKYYPIPFGGILASRKKLGNKKSLLSISENDSQKIRITISNATQLHHQWNKIRRSNWKFFADQLRRYKITPYFNLTEKIVPGVFLARLPKGFAGDIRKKKLNSIGVEATEYYGQGGFYFPVHQFLTDYEKKYILHHFIHVD